MGKNYVMMILAVLLFAGCLNSGGGKNVTVQPPKSGAGNIVSFGLSPSDVVLTDGGAVTHEFVLKLKEPAPEYISIRQENRKAPVNIKVIPEKSRVVKGEARGKLIFAKPPSYLLGDQKAVLLVTDVQGNLLGKITVDFYVLPPGAS